MQKLAVALAVLALPFAALASGSGGTTNVNVVNTPTVNVGNIPLVTVGNTPTVTVGNGLEKAQRFKAEMLGDSGYAWGQVPVGKRVLVQQITAYCALAPGEAPPTTMVTLGPPGSENLATFSLALPLQRVGIYGPYEVRDIYSANLTTSLILEAGDWILYAANFPAGPQSGDFMKVTVWGVMVDAPAP